MYCDSLRVLQGSPVAVDVSLAGPPCLAQPLPVYLVMNESTLLLYYYGASICSVLFKYGETQILLLADE